MGAVHVQPRLHRESDWSVQGQYSSYNPDGVLWTVSEWLKAEISDEYHRLSENINALNPSLSIENYRVFLQLQLQFYCHIDPLYADPVIRQMSLGLPYVGRTAPIRKDIADLGIASVPTPSSTYGLPGGLIQRIGWLFVAEVMRINSAELLSSVHRLSLDKNFGAHHLATLAGQRARQWGIFTTGLDNCRMSEMETERLYSGARSALAFAAKQTSAAHDTNPQLRLA